MKRHKSLPIQPASTQRPETRIRAEQAMAAGNFHPMEIYCQEIMRNTPDDEYACIHLGIIHDERKEYAEAIAIFEKGLKAHPDSPWLLHNLARTLGKTNDAIYAYDCAKRASGLAPQLVDIWISYTCTARTLRRYDEVFIAAQKAIAIAPANVAAQINMATYYLDTGRPHKAVEHYREVLKHAPESELAHNNMLLAMLYDEECSADDMTKECLRFSRLIDLPSHQIQRHSNLPEPWRKLRLAFIGADISNHPVSYFLEPVLARLDRHQYELIAFHTLAKGDHVTQRLKRYFDEFHIIEGLPPKETADRIRAARIDILIDFAGHTGGNGLAAMGQKPAPVQITWMGFPGTTGLKNIDIRLTDEIADACAKDGDYSESLYFLPAPFCVYRPCLRNPIQRYWPEYMVKPTPALKNGFITFGSCNNIAKIGRGPLNLWARILAAVPNSKLRIEAWGMDTEDVRSGFIGRCADAGIDADRLILLERDIKQQYLTYHDIDIALDPFPLTGGTTTFDTLWMGVPLVSLIGESFRSRMSTCLLSAAGLTQWLAEDGDAYVSIATRLATDIQSLNQTRLALRQHIERSSLMDERLFTIYFDNALRQAWINWCKTQGADIPEAPPAPIPEEQVFISPGVHVALPKKLEELAELVKAKRWDDVYVATGLILESIPQQADALAALAEADFANGYSMASSYISCAIDAAPERADLYLRMAEMLIAGDQHAAAQQILQLLAARLGEGTARTPSQ